MPLGTSRERTAAPSALSFPTSFACAPAGKNDADAKEPALELRCDLEGVAAVVARSGDDENGLCGIAAETTGEFGGGQARAFHKRAGRGGRALFQLAYRARRVDGKRGH